MTSCQDRPLWEAPPHRLHFRSGQDGDGGRQKQTLQAQTDPRSSRHRPHHQVCYLQTDSLTNTEAVCCAADDQDRALLHSLFHQEHSAKSGLPHRRPGRLAIFQGQEAELISGLEDFEGFTASWPTTASDQENSRAKIYLPVSQWIGSVAAPGTHPRKMGATSRSPWNAASPMSTANPATMNLMLTGCSGVPAATDVPQASKRLTPEGKPVYTYVCKFGSTQRALCEAERQPQSAGIRCDRQDTAGRR